MKLKITTAKERADEKRVRQWLAACTTVAELFPDTGITVEVWNTPEGYQIHGRGIELIGLDPATQWYELSGVLSEGQAIEEASNLITAKLKEYGK